MFEVNDINLRYLWLEELWRHWPNALELNLRLKRAEQPQISKDSGLSVQFFSHWVIQHFISAKISIDYPNPRATYPNALILIKAWYPGVVVREVASLILLE